MSSSATIVANTRDYCFATWQEFLVVFWKRDTTLEGALAVTEAMLRFGRSQADRIGVITVVEETATLPPGNVRDALAEFLKAGSGVIRASCLVHEGTGFRTAAIRTLVTGLTLLAKQPFPHKVFATVEDAASWIVPQMPHPYRADELLRAIGHLRGGERHLATGTAL